jgi:hypothetical protein
MGTIPSATSRPATIFSSTLNSNSPSISIVVSIAQAGWRRGGGDFGFDSIFSRDGS